MADRSFAGKTLSEMQRSSLGRHIARLAGEPVRRAQADPEMMDPTDYGEPIEPGGTPLSPEPSPEEVVSVEEDIARREAAAASPPPAEPEPMESVPGEREAPPRTPVSAGKEASSEQSAPTPGTYTAEGDPYTYQLLEDGGILLTEGPTGKGVTVRSGPAYDAIMAQIESGQLGMLDAESRIDQALSDLGEGTEALPGEPSQSEFSDFQRESLAKNMKERGPTYEMDEKERKLLQN